MTTRLYFTTHATKTGDRRLIAYAYIIIADGKTLAQHAGLCDEHETGPSAAFTGLLEGLPELERLQLVGNVELASDCYAVQNMMTSRGVTASPELASQRRATTAWLERLTHQGLSFTWRWVSESDNPAKALAVQVIEQAGA